MRHIKIKLLLTAICFFSVFVVISQENRQDSIAAIKQLQKEASNAISNQQFEDAIVKLIDADKQINEGGFKELKLDSKLHIAELNYYIQNYGKAKTEVELALKQIDNFTRAKTKAYTYTLYGLILTRNEEYALAEDYLKRADKLYAEQNDEAGQANTILGFGILELKLNNYKKAINYFNACLPTFRIEDLKYQEAFAEINKSQALLHVSNNEIKDALGKAVSSIENAERIVKARGYSKLNSEIYKVKAQIALRQGNSAEAEKVFQQYIILNDSINAVYKQAISKGVDAESSVGDLTEIIESKQSEIEAQARSLNLNKMTTALSIALIIILSLLTLSLYKNNNLRAKANNLLQDKNVEMQSAKEKAEKASLAKAQFLSTITHELRTPLYAVTGLTHLLLEEDPKEHQREHLNSLKFSGEYLLSLINNILDLNKLEANKVELEKTTFSLKKRINDVLIALKKSADDRKNTLRLEYDDNIPSKLNGDPLKLSQVLINLIGNSVKFTQNGEVVIRVTKMDQGASKVKLHVEVEDNGVGISKKKQKSIFETFSQASLQINRKFGGTGLGLSIVKNLLELMGSKIHLESQLGKGSKFWFNINFSIPEGLNDDSAATPAIVKETDYSALENKKVLVVEDNKINQMITKKILEKNNMVCDVADNGMDAVKKVEELTFDVILMDIHMPGISGIEATQKIREFNKSIPIIALTAVTIDENLDDFYRAGFNEIIPKPFKTEEFFEKIYKTLENKKLPTPS
ncbi:tetratricopeptide repeat-containing hybrid sensor histidine kinase/response regulator [Marinirhabdus gelatinilytica]|uniref:tetratricopeptide repeat-containing hybrid sensor histidine kinase/response regulator n=1 Tax=Marinirhabdus gelatinilytica TaxID=1703343 RepID=UPI001FE2FEE5|nr:response regulator [Marinirhabdus gelatinilytica]